MDRRLFIKTTLIGNLALSTTAFKTGKTHILTLSFDDGFKKSFYRIADIYEEFGLHACLNVIASGHLPSFQAVGQYILPELMGNFDDWNRLQERGHEVMPHSWQHLNLVQQPFEKATTLITRCLEYFEANLEGYRSSDAIFNFPFNASTPELEAFALTKVRAVRTSGKTALNPIPDSSVPVILGCQSKGPENIDHWVEQQVNEFLASSGGWLILNTHGLDEEGWGPMSATFLYDLLKRITKLKKLEILPAGEVLKKTTISKK